jgi:deoxycytidylate deaminase
MTPKLQKKLLSIVDRFKNLPRSKNKHFSFIIRRNKILSFGYNDGWKTSPQSQKNGYRFNSIHSELASLIKYRSDYSQLRKCKLINLRINRFGEIGMSRPCANCMKFITSLGINRIYYTNREGNFVKLR